MTTLSKVAIEPSAGSLFKIDGVIGGVVARPQTEGGLEGCIQGVTSNYISLSLLGLMGHI